MNPRSPNPRGPKPGPDICVLNLGSNGPGRTNPSQGSYNLKRGKTIRAIAIPNQGARFVQWEMDGSGFGNNPRIKINMNSDHSLLAIFNASGQPSPNQPGQRPATNQPQPQRGPRIVLAARPPVIRPGMRRESKLIWVSADADRVELLGYGNIGKKGSRRVNPQRTTTYYFTASNRRGSVREQVTVYVEDMKALPGPNQNMKALPPPKWATRETQEKLARRIAELSGAIGKIEQEIQRITQISNQRRLERNEIDHLNLLSNKKRDLQKKREAFMRIKQTGRYR
jgi:hypothetical protein